MNNFACLIMQPQLVAVAMTNSANLISWHTETYSLRRATIFIGILAAMFVQYFWNGFLSLPSTHAWSSFNKEPCISTSCIYPLMALCLLPFYNQTNFMKQSNF